MDPPLRQTIKSHLAYVNLTDAFFKQRFINSKGLLRRGYALPTPTRPYEATCEAEAAAFLGAGNDNG
jgi:hypothetical protein